jgi:hypothetical protein
MPSATSITYSAVAFYRHHGFIPLPDFPLTLFLPLATILSSR